MITGSRQNARFRKATVLVALLGCAVVSLLPAREQAIQDQAVDLDSLMPRVFKSWTYVEPSTPPASAADAPESITEMLVAAYRNSQGQSLVLTLEYGADFRRRNELHIPDYCHRARGDQVRVLAPLRVPLSEGRELPLQAMEWSQAGKHKGVLSAYWFVVGGRITESLYQLKWSQLLAGLFGEAKPVLLVRIDSFPQGSTTSSSRAEQERLVRDFISEMFASTSPEQQQILFGESEK